MTKRKNAKGGNRGGARGKSARPPRRYACAEPECPASGTAGEMKNLPCDPREITERDILPLIRCANCAQRQPEGTKTFRLAQTLGAIRKYRYAPDQRSGKDEREYVRWVTKGRHRRMIRDYAERYGELPYYGDPASSPDIVYPDENVGEDGTHRCGLPIGCCDKRAPAARYLTVLGEVVGICRTASAIFIDVRNAHRDEAQYRKLLATDDLDAARKFATRWLRGGR